MIAPPRVQTCSYTASPTASSRWTRKPPPTEGTPRAGALKFRGSEFASGLDFAIRSGGLTVFRSDATQHGVSFAHELIASGVVALDTLLGGGVDRRHQHAARRAARMR